MNHEFNNGQEMYAFARELFPICRSLTGDGVRETLRMIGTHLPGLKIVEVPSGEACFDWNVPPEWNIRDAYVKDAAGRRIIDFKTNNLHVVNYSEPVRTEMSLEELQAHLHSLPDQPNAIPYVTSYYRRTWGFCLTHEERLKLKPGRYEVVIDSTLEPGHLTYGELYLPGTSKREIFLSTYICHPSMANNEVSGPVLTTFLAKRMMSKQNKFSYRIVFVPETIGAIVYISRHLNALKKNVYAGYQVTCVGDDRCYSYLPSRKGGTPADRVATHVLSHHSSDYKRYSFADRGSDERQYCSPGVDLPMGSIMRSKYGEYSEYHTSLDNMDLISPEGFAGSFNVYTKCLELLEKNQTYRAKFLCEPQMGKRGLRPTLGLKNAAQNIRTTSNLLAYADGQNDLIDIANASGISAEELIPIADTLFAAGLLELTSHL
jgi:aminopeptidase-like protein